MPPGWLTRRLPRTAAAHFAALKRALDANDAEKGLALSEAAVRRYPTNAEIRFLHGVFMAESRPEEGARELVCAANLGVKDPLLLVSVGRQLINLRYVDAAIECARAADELIPVDSPDASDLRNLHARIAAECGRNEEAEADFRAALALDPLSESFAHDLVNFLVETDRVEEAIATIKESLPRVSSTRRLEQDLETIAQPSPNDET